MDLRLTSQRNSLSDMLTYSESQNIGLHSLPTFDMTRHLLFNGLCSKLGKKNNFCLILQDAGLIKYQ